MDIWEWALRTRKLHLDPRLGQLWVCHSKLLKNVVLSTETCREERQTGKVTPGSGETLGPPFSLGSQGSSKHSSMSLLQEVWNTSIMVEIWCACVPQWFVCWRLDLRCGRDEPVEAVQSLVDSNQVANITFWGIKQVVWNWTHSCENGLKGSSEGLVVGDGIAGQCWKLQEVGLIKGSRLVGCVLQRYSGHNPLLSLLPFLFFFLPSSSSSPSLFFPWAQTNLPL